MIKKTSFTFLLVMFAFCNCSNKEEIETSTDTIFKGEIKVLTLNTWYEGNKVENGYNALVDVIIQSEADIVVLQEIRNYNGVIFSDRILKSLKDRGLTFYSINSGKSPLALSKFPIVSTTEINSSSLSKIVVKLDGETNIAVYAAHLDYTHYACYLPRGYDGITWEKLPAPVTDLDKILKQNIDSGRDEAITLFLEDAKVETDNGNMVFLAGDFNEPSHLDWTEATKNLFDHNGTVVPWHNSVTLQEKGYLDAYRVKYPNSVTHPGFTWAAYNTDVALSELVWTPDADDRDRIDYIYFKNDSRIVLSNAIIVGPSGSIVKGQGFQDDTLLDKFLLPQGKWPSDHKGVLATFTIN